MTAIRKIGFFFAFLLPAAVVLGYASGGIWILSTFALAFLLYGIERKEVGSDRYERVTSLLSRNASQIISNFFLFQLQRHPDHHANPIKRYQVLDNYDESPQLPAGFSTMILLALEPSLWFKLMNHRLEAWQERSVGQLT